MNQSARWALCPIDGQAHLLAAGDHPWGWVKARCGYLLPAHANQHQRPWSPRRPCSVCAQITQRPTVVPGQRWVSPRDTPAGRETVLRTRWVRCPIQTRLVHLLAPTAVLQLAAQGATVASCGALLTTEDLAAQEGAGRGMGVPCLRCLTAGNAGGERA